MKILRVIPLLLVVAAFVVGIVLYPQLPERMASHWGINGEVNGYMGKFWGVFLMPVVMAVLYFMFVIIPRIDPRKENIQKFKKYFEVFILTLFAILFSLFIITLEWNLGRQVDFGRYMSGAFGVLFFVIGLMISKAEPNWTVGIRTPWTLSSESVWRQTHQLGGRLVKAAAIVCLVGLIFPQYAFWFIVVPVIASFLYSTIYSYIVYAREKRQSRLA